MNVLLAIRYDGSRYAGWQRQENAVAVQQVVEDALSKLLGEKITIYGAGRTDAGVHAYRQFANFHIKEIRIGIGKLPYAMQALLPEDIVCYDASEVEEAFHARKSAIEKEYRYFFYTEKSVSPFLNKRAVFFDGSVEAIRQNVNIFWGKHDFSAFVCANNPSRDPDVSPIRTITSIGVRFSKSYRAGYIYVRSSGFLYKMVRRIVGCLFDLGRGRITGGKVLSMLKSGGRDIDWNTALPYGLYLWKVKYHFAANMPFKRT